MAAKTTKKPARKSGTKKATGSKSTAKKAATSEKPEAEEPAPKANSGIRSNQVVLAHIFALKPRVAMAFKPDDFRQAKQLLEDESYESIPEAARAVAERALELTNTGMPKGARKRR
ncbi:MAG: hypothetical protein VX246_05455 [Myxococcota bacterium]|nr:hypothetical protein [Myxococcota bacterium]